MRAKARRSAWLSTRPGSRVMLRSQQAAGAGLANTDLGDSRLIRREEDAEEGGGGRHRSAV